jgi:hypothetical protein
MPDAIFRSHQLLQRDCIIKAFVSPQGIEDFSTDDKEKYFPRRGLRKSGNNITKGEKRTQINFIFFQEYSNFTTCDKTN